MGCCVDTATHFSSIYTDAARNRALVLSFGFLAPNPPSPARICKHNARNRHHFEQDARDAPPLTCTTHHLRLARQTWNQAHNGLVSGFRPSTPFPCLRLPHQHPEDQQKGARTYAQLQPKQQRWRQQEQQQQHHHQQ